MSALQQSDGRTLCRSWCQMVTSLLGCQWKIVASQCEAGVKLTEAALRVLPADRQAGPEERAEAASQSADGFRGLERRAAERVRQGLAPPKGIYETPYRDRIDWSRFPAWARPSDPELFEGCGHEG